MIKSLEAIQKLENIIYSDEQVKSIDIDELESCLQIIKELCEEKDVHRFEVVATGNVFDIKYFDNVQGNRLINFLFQKSKKDKKGNWIRGKLSCIMAEEKCQCELKNGDRVKIYGDLSPYTTHRSDGMTFEKIRIWVEKIERLDKGDPNYIHKKEIERFIL